MLVRARRGWQAAPRSVSIAIGGKRRSGMSESREMPVTPAWWTLAVAGVLVPIAGYAWSRYGDGPLSPALWGAWLVLGVAALVALSYLTPATREWLRRERERKEEAWHREVEREREHGR